MLSGVVANSSHWGRYKEKLSVSHSHLDTEEKIVKIHCDNTLAVFVVGRQTGQFAQRTEFVDHYPQW